jgi:hypothetical protein
VVKSADVKGRELLRCESRGDFQDRFGVARMRVEIEVGGRIQCNVWAEQLASVLAHIVHETPFGELRCSSMFDSYLSTSIGRNVFSNYHSLDCNRGIFYALNCSHLHSPVTSQCELLVLPTKTTWTLANLRI